MRELATRLFVIFTVSLVVALALRFALARNPIGHVDRAGASSVNRTAPVTSAIVRGRAVYEGQHCASCHAIAGRGNPRHPLDGVGERRPDANLRAAIIGAPEAGLAEAIARRKAAFRDLPRADLAALEAYLRSVPAAK